MYRASNNEMGVNKIRKMKMYEIKEKIDNNIKQIK